MVSSFFAASASFRWLLGRNQILGTAAKYDQRHRQDSKVNKPESIATMVKIS